jgi:hypothetical protein
MSADLAKFLPEFRIKQDFERKPKKNNKKSRERMNRYLNKIFNSQPVFIQSNQTIKLRGVDYPTYLQQQKKTNGYNLALVCIACILILTRLTGIVAKMLINTGKQFSCSFFPCTTIQTSFELPHSA